jgi:hypothetical protein
MRRHVGGIFSKIDPIRGDRQRQIVSPGQPVEQSCTCAVADPIEIEQFKFGVYQHRIGNAGIRQKRICKDRRGRRGHAEMGVQIEIGANRPLQKARRCRHGRTLTILRNTLAEEYEMADIAGGAPFSPRGEGCDVESAGGVRTEPNSFRFGAQLNVVADAERFRQSVQHLPIDSPGRSNAGACETEHQQAPAVRQRTDLAQTGAIAPTRTARAQVRR